MKRMCLLIGVSLLVVSIQVSGEELELKFGGKLQSDLRFRLETKGIGGWYHRLEMPAGVARNENLFKLKLDAVYGSVAGVVDVDLVIRGYPEEINDIGELSSRGRVDPYYLQTHALYVEFTDFLVDMLDLRIGQQLVLWGKADQFNPTNTINSNDVEDVLLFGEQLANFLVRLDYSFLDQWTISGVLVPVFKPGLLPRSAELGPAAVDRLPFIDMALRHRIHFEKSLSDDFRYPTVVSQAKPILPETTIDNMQFAFRLAGTIFEQDIAFSYYRGRSDVPQAVRNYTTQDLTERCNPAVAEPEETDCINGLLVTEASLAYPKMQVVGFNMAGEIPLTWISNTAHSIGYRLEVGVYFPENLEIELYQEEVTIGMLTQPAGEYEYGLGQDQYGNPIRPLVVDDTPFLKWTLGLDYSFGRHVYMNVMWVHGMFDDFGAGDFLHKGFAVRQGGSTMEDPMSCMLQQILTGSGLANGAKYCGTRGAREILRPRIGDYVVFGVDLKFADDKALLRLFAIWDISGYYEDYYDGYYDEDRQEWVGQRVRKYLPLFGDGFTGVFFPEFNYNFGSGLELGFGALVQFGKPYTKFGDPAAGGSLIWTRARYSY